MMTIIREQQQVFSFDDDDLMQNRAGNLSEKQRQYLAEQNRFRSGCFAALIVVVAVAACVLALAGEIAWQVMLFGVATLTLMLAGFIFWNQQALRSARVARVSGIAEPIYIGDDEYGMRIGDKRFRVLEKQHDAFNEGDKYTVYYLPGNNKIVSVEPARKTKKS